MAGQKGQQAPQQNNQPGEINTPHGQEFIKKEIETQLDMRYPVNASDVSEIANEYGVQPEEVLGVLEAYLMKKEKQKDEDLTTYVADILHDYFPSSVEKRLPTFEEFYNKFKSFSYDEEFSPKEVKEKFIKLTTDPNQLSLFEVRRQIKKIIWEAVKKII